MRATILLLMSFPFWCIEMPPLFSLGILSMIPLLGAWPCFLAMCSRVSVGLASSGTGAPFGVFLGRESHRLDCAPVLVNLEFYLASSPLDCPLVFVIFLGVGWLVCFIHAMAFLSSFGLVVFVYL